jgi:hypothetical protein
MTYELWHLDAGSMIGSYANQDEALGIVRQAATRNGPQYVEAIALLRSDEDGRVQTIAEGDALADLAGIVREDVTARAAISTRG